MKKTNVTHHSCKCKILNKTSQELLDMFDLKYFNEAIVPSNPQNVPEYGDRERVHEPFLLGNQMTEELAVLIQDVNGVTSTVRHQDVALRITTHAVGFEVLFPALSVVDEPEASVFIQDAQSAGV